MGAEEAISATVSQPVSSSSTLRFSFECKKYEALQNSSDLKRGLYESRDAYEARRAKYYEEQRKQIVADNTAVAEKRYQGIQNLYLSQTTDPKKLESGLSQMNALFSFTTYNNVDTSFMGNNMYKIMQHRASTENRLYNYKNGKDYSSGTSYPTLYDGSYQAPGTRDVLG